MNSPPSEHEVHCGFEVGDSSKDTIQRDRESMHLSSTTTNAPVWVSSHAIDQPPTLPPSLSCPRSHCHHQPACRLPPSPAMYTWKLVIYDASCPNHRPPYYVPVKRLHPNLIYIKLHFERTQSELGINDGWITQRRRPPPLLPHHRTRHRPHRQPSAMVCKTVERQIYLKRLNEQHVTAILMVTCEHHVEREKDLLIIWFCFFFNWFSLFF